MKQFFIFLLSIFVVSFLGAAIKSCKPRTSDKPSVISSDTVYLKDHYAYQLGYDFGLVGVYNNGNRKEVAHKNKKQINWAIEDTGLALSAALQVIEENLNNQQRFPVYIFGNDTIHLSYGDTVRVAPCNMINPSPSPLPDSTPIKYRYIIRIEATPQQWSRAMYISDSIMLHWGKERGGTEIEKTLNMYSAVMDFLRTAAKVDSVRITGGKP